MVRRLPAVLTPTCCGSARHSVRPPHEDIELRVCAFLNNDDTLEVIELFVYVSSSELLTEMLILCTSYVSCSRFLNYYYPITAVLFFECTFSRKMTSK